MSCYISFCLWFALPGRLLILNIFSSTCWQFVYLFWRNVYSHPLSIFQSGKLFFDTELQEFLHILNTNPISDKLFPNIFSIPYIASHSVKRLFAIQKLLSLIYFHWSIFAFASYAFSVITNKSLPHPISWSFPHNVFS